MSANGKRITTHYLGWPVTIRRRIEHHQDNSSGSKFMEYVNNADVTWVVTRLWLGASRSQERQFKNQKHAWRLCPRCKPSLLRSITRRAPTQDLLPF